MSPFQRSCPVQLLESVISYCYTHLILMTQSITVRKTAGNRKCLVRRWIIMPHMNSFLCSDSPKVCRRKGTFLQRHTIIWCSDDGSYGCLRHPSKIFHWSSTRLRSSEKEKSRPKLCKQNMWVGSKSACFQFPRHATPPEPLTCRSQIFRFQL